MTSRIRPLALALGLALAIPASWAQPGSQAATRDIVLDMVAPQSNASSPPSAAVKGDAMAISVLLESADGSLTPRGTDKLFRTGDRFRVKLLASRAGKVSLYNTNPAGVFNPKPLWQGTVTPGLETISPRLLLDGSSGAGVDKLHVVLEPEGAPSGIAAWLQSLLKTSRDQDTGRDIKLDVDHTAASSYVLNPLGQGLQTTIQIVHQR